MAARPHAQYTNPIFGRVHWCPARQAYVKAAELPRDRPGECRCGKRLKTDKRG